MAQKKKPQLFNLYRIDWIDAKASGGWKRFDEYQITNLVIHSVGWLIKENKDYYVLAQQMGSNAQFSDTIQIPKQWIKRKRLLRKNTLEYRSDE